MSSPRPLELQLLSPALQLLEQAAPSQDATLEVLEAAASRLGGFALSAYRKRFKTATTLRVQQAMEIASTVLDTLKSCPIPPSLALSAMARPRLGASELRTSGAYHTDFRLAQHIAAAAAQRLVPGAQIIDPAAGTGILLVAATMAACGPDRVRCAKWLAESVTAWDLSQDALRGARLALASMTDDLEAVASMTARWRCHDSLLVEEAPWGGFDVVLGNPPWERVKLTRHEYLRANGGTRHYGADYGPLDAGEFASHRDNVARYGSALAANYPLLGRGEPDLYKAFLELFVKLIRPGGCVSVLVPAGLIRSQGTESLRRFLFGNTEELSITILENRTRFFAIDTRFKFVGLAFTKSSAKRRAPNLLVLHATGSDDGLIETGRASVSRKALEAIRSDLTVPEVRSDGEWRLFRRMSEHSTNGRSSNPRWMSEIVREVDMTRDRQYFVQSSHPGLLPLIEGRMVHQYRFGAKAYRSGTGRRARWDVIPLGSHELAPQFWYPRVRMSQAVRDRTTLPRAGFCDITGQTNERSILAALIPPGVVCGNKVPTVRFPNDPSEERLLLWVAIVNSFSFDWAIRRILTTTVNYFLLNSVPFPRLEPKSLPGRRIVDAARELHFLNAGDTPADPWRVAKLRASIDVAVHAAYGLTIPDLEIMLRDFPLLDGGQPPLHGERRSTITRDFLLDFAASHFEKRTSRCAERFHDACALGAIPYVPSQYQSPSDDDCATEVIHD